MIARLLWATIPRSYVIRPFDLDRRILMHPRVAPRLYDADPRSLLISPIWSWAEPPRKAACFKVSRQSRSLRFLLTHVLWWWSHGLGSIRSTCFIWCDRIQRALFCHVSFKEKVNWEHSPMTCCFCASLKHKYEGQTKFIKPNSQKQDIIIKYWVSIGSIHREQGWL